MKFAFYTNVISPHQIPLARELVSRLGVDRYRYVYTTPQMMERIKLGWTDSQEPWLVPEFENPERALQILDEYDVVMSGVRDVALFDRRSCKGLLTLYTSERWFKPWVGMMRLFAPSYCRMAWRFAKLLRASDKMLYLPIGVHAARDMARLCGLFSGDLRCLFRAPDIEFERVPFGRIWLRGGDSGKRYCLDKMRMWGYYVEPSKAGLVPVLETSKTKAQEIKVLWVGRLLNLKRVDTIVRAVGEHANLRQVDDSLPKITLDIYGQGPAEMQLRKMALKYGDIVKFHPPVPIAEVRKLMREHDVYVLASNAYEGWGAVVSEALEERVPVVGTYEAGSCVSILPDSNLFHAGDWRKLLQLLRSPLLCSGIGEWSARSASNRLVEECLQ